MSLFLRSRAGPRVRQPGPGDLSRCLSFLERRASENVFLAHLLRRDGFGRAAGSRQWHLAEEDGEPRGMCLASVNIVPAAEDDEPARLLGGALGRVRRGTQSLVGERSVVNAVWESLRRRAPAPRLVREEQPLYLLDRAAFGAAAPADGSRLALRPARTEDLDVLVEACADMLREEILDDPCARDPVAFRAQVWRLVQEGAILVGEVNGRIVFKAHANVRTPLAAQISGVYTMPAQRGRGHGGAGMWRLAHRLLEEVPSLCLYVNHENAAAIRLYEAVGFRRAGTFKSIFFPSEM